VVTDLNKIKKKKLEIKIITKYLNIILKFFSIISIKNKEMRKIANNK
jgi:hypothetical protein